MVYYELLSSISRTLLFAAQTTAPGWFPLFFFRKIALKRQKVQLPLSKLISSLKSFSTPQAQPKSAKMIPNPALKNPQKKIGQKNNFLMNNIIQKEDHLKSQKETNNSKTETSYLT